MLKAERVSKQYLFNLMNRTAPLRFIDVRSKEAFEQCHLNTLEYNTINILSNVDAAVATDYSAMLNDSMLKIGDNMVVIVTDSSVDDSVPEHITEIINSRRSGTSTTTNTGVDTGTAVGSMDEGKINRWDKICAVYWVDFDSFVQAYSSCTAMFIMDDAVVTTPTTASTTSIVSATPKLDCAVKHKKRRFYPTEIIPGFLYLGDYTDGGDPVVLRDLQLTHLVDATNRDSSKTAAESVGVAYLPVRIWDMEDVDMSLHVPAVLEFIEEAAAIPDGRGRVLIHCQAGISRAATLTMAYLISSRRATLREAIILTVTHRPQVRPNDSFRLFLVEHEMRVCGQSSLLSMESGSGSGSGSGSVPIEVQVKVDMGAKDVATPSAAQQQEPPEQEKEPPEQEKEPPEQEKEPPEQEKEHDQVPNALLLPADSDCFAPFASLGGLDAVFMALLRDHSNLWTAWTDAETCHDRIPVLAGRMDEATKFKGAFVEKGEGNPASDQPKRSFLKRGAGKSRGKAVPQPITDETDVLPGPVVVGGESTGTAAAAASPTPQPLSPGPTKPCPAVRMSIAELKKAHRQKQKERLASGAAEESAVMICAGEGAVGLCGVRVRPPVDQSEELLQPEQPQRLTVATVNKRPVEFIDCPPSPSPNVDGPVDEHVNGATSASASASALSTNSLPVGSGVTAARSLV